MAPNIQHLQRHHHQGTLGMKGTLHHKGMQVEDMVSNTIDQVGIRVTSMMGTLHHRLLLLLNLTHIPRSIIVNITIVKKMGVPPFLRGGKFSSTKMIAYSIF